MKSGCEVEIPAESPAPFGADATHLQLFVFIRSNLHFICAIYLKFRRNISLIVNHLDHCVGLSAHRKT